MGTSRSLAQRNKTRRVLSTRMIEVEEIRSCLPLRQYLELAHTAIVTGRMPRFDIHPDQPHMWIRTPPEQDDILSTNQRLEVLAKLVDKAMPDVKSGDYSDPSVDVEAIVANPSITAQDLDSLPADQLRKIIEHAAKLVAPAQDQEPAEARLAPSEPEPAAPTAPDISVFFAPDRQ